MHAEEMAVKRLAKPIPQLRVQTQMLPVSGHNSPSSFFAAERIQACLQLKCPMTGEINFSPQIKRGSSPIRNIALDPNHGAFPFDRHPCALERNGTANKNSMKIVFFILSYSLWFVNLISSHPSAPQDPTS